MKKQKLSASPTPVQPAPSAQEAKVTPKATAAADEGGITQGHSKPLICYRLEDNFTLRKFKSASEAARFLKDDLKVVSTANATTILNACGRAPDGQAYGFGWRPVNPADEDMDDETRETILAACDA